MRCLFVPAAVAFIALGTAVPVRAQYSTYGGYTTPGVYSGYTQKFSRGYGTYGLGTPNAASVNPYRSGYQPYDGGYSTYRPYSGYSGSSRTYGSNGTRHHGGSGVWGRR